MQRVPLRLLALVPIAVAINLSMGKIVSTLALPVFMDTVGTVLAAALAGPWVALLTGFVSQGVIALFVNPVQGAFLPIQLYVAVFAALAASRYSVFKSTRRALGTGLILGATAATLSWPIAFLAFGGVTSPGVSTATTVLSSLGLPLGGAVYVASLSSDLMDKAGTFLLVRALLVSLPVRTLVRFPNAGAALGRDA